MYDVLLNDVSVGNVQVDKEGLYYIFRCTCKFPGNEIYRIRVCNGTIETMLGVCVPEGDWFVLNRKIPIKNFEGDIFRFTAELQHENGVSVETGKPFAYIDKLETARLQTTNGQIRIVID